MNKTHIIDNKTHIIDNKTLDFSSKKINRNSQKQIRIVGTYISDQFGELWDKSLAVLINEAVNGVIKSVSKNHDFDPEEIEAVFIANMASGLFNNQLHLNAMVSQIFNHYPPAIRVEGACASGSLALITAQNALNSGRYKTVLVLGVEKMTDLNSNEATKVLSSASDYDFEYGSTFPALYALLAKAHMHKYGTTREQLSAVSVKNHRHAINNPKAHFRKIFTSEQVSKSSMVADPLRLLDCSPVSDGASAVILSTKEVGNLLNLNKKDISKSRRKNKIISYENKPKIIGFGHAQDSLSLANRQSLTSLLATKKAAKEAFAHAGITHNDVKVAEVHDCFTIAEILAIEDLGFFKPGTGGKATLDGKTTFGGEIIINPSGGLKACGHPVGATGVKQVAYLAEFLENQDKIGFKPPSGSISESKLGLRKQKFQYALAHNVGGSGATVVVHILEK
ncbi:MAG: thiolase domain-containing protein [Pseudomonadales bacterium]|nr:thiolase domain-containing protein [Pseudomonadales bacterium]